MLYLMLIYQDEAKMKAASPAEQEAVGKGYGELNAFLAQSGASRGTASWPAGVITVRAQDGNDVVTDGPLAQTGERVAGFFLVEAADRDSAVEIAKRVPGRQFGGVEIRPVQGQA